MTCAVLSPLILLSEFYQIMAQGTQGHLALRRESGLVMTPDIPQEHSLKKGHQTQEIVW